MKGKLWILSFLWIQTIGAQQDSLQKLNPFELENRLPEAYSYSTSANNSNNPFEVRGNSAVLNITSIPDRATSSTLKVFKSSPNASEKAAMLKPSRVPSYFFWIFLGLLFFLSFIITGGRAYITRMFRTLGNENLFRLTHREFTGSFQSIYLLLFIFFILNAAIFTYLALGTLGYSIWQIPVWKLLFWLIGAIFGVLFFKYLIVSALGIIFDVKKTVSQYHFSLLILLNLMGLVIFPTNILLAYGSAQASYSLVITILILAGLLFLFHYLRSLNLARRYILDHGLHFIVYLCTVEIAPVLILIRWFSDMAGSGL